MLSFPRTVLARPVKFFIPPFSLSCLSCFNKPVFDFYHTLFLAEGILISFTVLLLLSLLGTLCEDEDVTLLAVADTGDTAAPTAVVAAEPAVVLPLGSASARSSSGSSS